MSRFPRFAVLTACAFTLSLGTTLADGVVKPFKITGTGVAPQGLPFPGQPARPHWIVGNATHLGKHSGFGFVQTESVAYNPEKGVFAGVFGSGPGGFDFVGANGDVLACDYGRTGPGGSATGTFTLVPTGELTANGPVVVAYFIADFVPVPTECTGKFAGISGRWVMYAVTEPFDLFAPEPAPLAYSWEGTGKLTFKKK